MQYISTATPSLRTSLTNAIVHPVAPDGGIYMPATLPVVPRAFFNNIDQLRPAEIAYVVANTLFGDDVDGAVLKRITDESCSYRMPVRRIADRLYVMELFHGPSLSFKDFGTRFLARLYRHLASQSAVRHINVLVATTGNSGSAIADAFRGLDGVDVFILYPHGSLTRMQEAQFATLGGNTHPLEVHGTIDDCNRLVDAALVDRQLNTELHLASANSLNLGRVLPQVTYFFEACARLQSAGLDPSATDFAMPCGNLSNVTAAAIAKRMGAPIGGITGACRPGAFADLAAGGVFPAFDISDSYPANMPRLGCLYAGDADALRRDIRAEVFTEEQQENAVREVLDRTGYIAEPRSASAILSLMRRPDSQRPGIAMVNTHPAKFLDRMTAITARAIELPLQLNRAMGAVVRKERIYPTLPALRKILLKHNLI